MTYCVCSITLGFKPLLPIEWTAESEELTPSLHQELTNLADAGLRPAEAHAAAAPARRFSLTDRGRIAPGLRADLLLIDRAPTTDITATRVIPGVRRHGVAVAWEALRDFGGLHWRLVRGTVSACAQRAFHSCTTSPALAAS